MTDTSPPASSGFATTSASPITLPCTPQSKSGAPVICVYVLDEQSRAQAAAGSADSAARRDGGWRSRCARWRTASHAIGAALVLRRGRAADVIAALAREIGAEPCSGTRSRRRRIWPIADDVDRRTRRPRCRRCRVFPATCWCSPRRSAPRKAAGLRVFTPFWRRILAMGEPAKPLPAPKKLNRRTAGGERRTHRLEARTRQARLGRRPARDVDTRRSRSAKTSASVSSKATSRATAGDRDRPDRDGTSRLSPHLRFGEISPRQVWYAARFAAAEHPATGAAISRNS